MKEMCKETPPCGIGSERRRSCVMGKEPLNESFFRFRATQLGTRLQLPSNVSLCKALSYDYRNNSSVVLGDLELATMLKKAGKLKMYCDKVRKAIDHLAMFQTYSEYLHSRISEYLNSRKPHEPLFNESDVFSILFHRNTNALLLQNISENFREVVNTGNTIDFALLRVLAISESKLIVEKRLQAEIVERIERILSPYLHLANF